MTGVPIGLALALPTNSKTRLERVSKDKRSSLLVVIISDKGKKVLYYWDQMESQRMSEILRSSGSVSNTFSFLVFFRLGGSWMTNVGQGLKSDADSRTE